MEQNGFTVQVNDVENLATIKNQYHVPAQIQSCHTAIVDGYVIEGHVPVAEIRRLLEEHPPITGLAVPGMPVGSPGMEVDGFTADPFNVIAFDAQGNMEIFASYGD
jgi:hypothetical protein